MNHEINQENIALLSIRKNSFPNVSNKKLNVNVEGNNEFEHYLNIEDMKIYD